MSDEQKTYGSGITKTADLLAHLRASGPLHELRSLAADEIEQLTDMLKRALSAQPAPTQGSGDGEPMEAKILRDILESIKTLHGEQALLDIAAHARRINKVREDNEEIDALERLLTPPASDGPVSHPSHHSGQEFSAGHQQNEEAK